MPDQKKILIVDDDDSIVKTIQIIMERNGYDTILASDGVEGLEALQNQNPDLILCDRCMPELSGYELLKTIRNDYPEYNKIPFIYLTVLDDERDKEATKELKPTAYLTKPVDFDELLAVIKTALEN